MGQAVRPYTTPSLPQPYKDSFWDWGGHAGLVTGQSIFNGEVTAFSVRGRGIRMEFHEGESQEYEVLMPGGRVALGPGEGEQPPWPPWPPWPWLGLPGCLGRY